MQSKVSLITKYSHNKTVYDSIFFTPPYKIISPLYETLYGKEEANIVLMSSSAGLLKGDKVEMDFTFKENSCAKITSQSYEKIFDTQEGKVEKILNIMAEKNTHISYMPYPTILFKNSNYMNKAQIRLSKNATFFYSDIFSAGRIHMGESFLMNKFQSLLHVYVENKLIFADNTYINPKKYKYNSLGLWGGYTHNGLLYAFFPKEEDENAFLSYARQKAKEDRAQFEFGASKSHKGICIRVLGNNGDKIYNYFNEISRWVIL